MQNTHFQAAFGKLHAAVLDIVVAMNRPTRDEVLLREAGLALNRALLPVIVCVERFGPIGVVDLADALGRDYTTVSRQIARLEELGLAERTPNPADQRIKEARLTPPGLAAVARINAARERLGRAALGDWSAEDLETLARLARRFADDLREMPAREERK